MNTQHSASSVTVRPNLARTQLVRALGDFRREWQQTTGTADLIEVAVPVGLVIADIAQRLGLTPQERLSVLGRGLNSAVSTYLGRQVHLK
jgi:hypothetical protein